jgi:LPXTG-motif cell wall-anchored protein
LAKSQLRIQTEVSVAVPAGVRLGEHTVQMTGVSADGELRVLNVAIVVVDAPGTGDFPVLPVAAGIAALVLIGAFLAMRRRSTEQLVSQP